MSGAGAAVGFDRSFDGGLVDVPVVRAVASRVNYVNRVLAAARAGRVPRSYRRRGTGDTAGGPGGSRRLVAVRGAIR